MDLRERLIGRKLAGTKYAEGSAAFAYRFRTNEEAADVAVEVFAALLRDEATGDLMSEATEAHAIDFGITDADGHNPCVCGRWWDSVETEGWDQHMAYVGLAALADAIDPQPERTEL